jgi:hypothetical protein
MERERRILPGLALVTGLAWMAAVLLVAANQKGISLAGDLAYDRANRVHTVALLFLLATTFVVYRLIRAGGLPGSRAAKALVIGAALMLVGNVVAFWGALVVGRYSEDFWGGLVGWLTFLPGELLVLGAFIALARAARRWSNVGRAQRWSIGLTGVLFSITTATWAISPAATLVPAALAAFALLTTGTAVTRASSAGSPAVPAEAVNLAAH